MIKVYKNTEMLFQQQVIYYDFYFAIQTIRTYKNQNDLFTH